ncbi:RNA polymerase sigma factor [Pedobacter sp. P26]|uniref:RNA polymerase sigma factor n=1 Tax=Pedobacter sp. P26 TaxID=3423956 RepID=UPI003D6670F0
MNSPNESADQQLLSLLIQGEEAAYTLLYNRYKHLLFLFASKRLSDPQDAEDILHEIFLSLWNNRESLNPETNLSAYLYSAVRYHIINQYAKAKTAARYLDSFNDYLSQNPNTEETDHLLRHKELAALIEKEISQLPKKMREVFQLSRDSGYSRQQIAEALGLSEETVKSHLHHALKILKTKLGSMSVLLFF